MHIGKQFWFGVGCACTAAALIWEPRYHRELIIVGLIAFTIGMARYLKDTLHPQ